MNLFEMLHKDHEKVAEIFGRIEETKEGDEARREDLFQSLHRELDVHSRAEEKFFYSRLKGDDETRELVLESLDEHRDLKKALEELAAMDKGSVEWTARIRACREMVESHVAEEEHDLFPRARRVLGEEEADAIAEEIGSFKEEHAELEAY